MACQSCIHRDGSAPSPTDQCLYCAQKHMDEAWTCMHEYRYTRSNLRYIRGSFRAIVLHTFGGWPAIADMARKCFLAFQDGTSMDGESVAKPLESMAEKLGDMIDTAIEESRNA